MSEFDRVYGSYLNDSGITPRGFKILVEIPKPKEKKGLIFVTQQTQEKEQNQAVIAKVLQLGHLCYRKEGKQGEVYTPWCTPGDFVAMSPYSGNRIRVEGSDRHLRFIHEDAIDGIVTVDPDQFEKA